LHNNYYAIRKLNCYFESLKKTDILPLMWTEFLYNYIEYCYSEVEIFSINCLYVKNQNSTMSFVQHFYFFVFVIQIYFKHLTVKGSYYEILYKNA